MGINFLISGDGQPLNWRKCSAFPSSNHVETTLNATQARESVLITFALHPSYLLCFDFCHQQKLGGVNVTPAIKISERAISYKVFILNGGTKIFSVEIPNI